MFGITARQDIAHVEVGTDARAVHFVEKIAQFKRRKQKLVPHIFDANCHAHFFRRCFEFTRCGQGVIISDIVRRALKSGNEIGGHAAGHQENSI